MLKISVDYVPPNWNKYINLERRSFYGANSLKQKEKNIMKLSTIGVKYEGKYPVKITFKPHFKDYRQDLDNFRAKGLLDGLVANGVIKNDNLKCINLIIIEPIIDGKEITEIEINDNSTK